jgi:hypothetical protein
MKQKIHNQVQPPENVRSHNQQARQDIQNFKSAVNSYPAQAAKKPRLTFQQHLLGLLAQTLDRAPRRNS